MSDKYCFNNFSDSETMCQYLSLYWHCIYDGNCAYRKNDCECLPIQLNRGSFK